MLEIRIRNWSAIYLKIEFYRLLITVPLKMCRRFGWPIWILVSQMLKFGQKMTNDWLLFLALVLWITRQSTWMTQAIYWKSHKTNSGWWYLFFLFICIIRCSLRFNSWPCAVFTITDITTNINSQLHLLADVWLFDLLTYNFNCWPSNPLGWFGYFGCMDQDMPNGT